MKLKEAERLADLLIKHDRLSAAHHQAFREGRDIARRKYQEAASLLHDEVYRQEQP